MVAGVGPLAGCQLAPTLVCVCVCVGGGPTSGVPVSWSPSGHVLATCLCRLACPDRVDPLRGPKGIPSWGVGACESGVHPAEWSVLRPCPCPCPCPCLWLCRGCGGCAACGAVWCGVVRCGAVWCGGACSPLDAATATGRPALRRAPCCTGAVCWAAKRAMGKRGAVFGDRMRCCAWGRTPRLFLTITYHPSVVAWPFSPGCTHTHTHTHTGE